MLVHGWQKLSAYSGLKDKFPDPIGVGSHLSLILAIGAEAGCALLLILGLFSRLATIPLAFTMVVALFIVHANDPWKVKELAALFLAIYVGLFFTGPGAFSIDQRLLARRSAGTTPPAV